MAERNLKNRLHLLRKRFGLSQDFLCEKIGVTKKTLYGYERCLRPVPSDKLIEFARLYKCSTDYILCLDSEAEGKDE